MFHFSKQCEMTLILYQSMSSVNWIQFFGGLAIGLGIGVVVQKATKSDKPEPCDDEEDDEWEDETSSEEEGEVQNGIVGPTKMVLAVRTNLKMGKGKIAAQCGHAAVAAFKKATKSSPEWVKAWEMDGSRKIAVKIENEEEMMTIYALAKSLGIITAIIQDAGRTQIDPGSKTVVAVFGPEDLVDQVTRHLSLL